jgi:hypothetical protein
MTPPTVGELIRILAAYPFDALVETDIGELDSITFSLDNYTLMFNVNIKALEKEIREEIISKMGEE